MRLRVNGIEFLYDQETERIVDTVFFDQYFKVELFETTKLKLISDQFNLYIDIPDKKSRQL